MDVVKKLEELKSQINPEIEKYFKRVIAETEKVDETITEAIKYVRKIMLAGGKRARAIFMYYGYLAAGGKETEKIIKTSVSIEFIHIFLLIHDDIIDQDEKRHGITTTHNHYKNIGKRFLKNRNPEHFGNSVAIIIGDMVGALGNQILYESKFESSLIVKALIKLQNIVSLTCVGETEDVFIENTGMASEKKVLQMYENKTARYTIEGPLHLGAILAGADDKLLKVFSQYSVPVGIAFQIQDDILGIFGNEEKMGKPVGSDVRQGKQTILVAKAYEKADSRQKKILDGTLGKKDLTVKDLENFKSVIKETGSLDYAKKLAEKLIAEGKSAIFDSGQGVKMKKEAREFLLGIGDYIINRNV